MRIAILANADSFWTKKYVENVMLPLDHKVYIISAKNEKFGQFYRDNNVDVFTTAPADSGFLDAKCRALMVSYNTKRSVEKLNCDINIVHYAYIYVLRLLKYTRMKGKLIITYWGSDILRESEKMLLSVKKTVYAADKLVAMTDELKDKLIKIYGETVEEKISIIDMGITAFDSIDRIREKRAEARKALFNSQLPSKIVVTAGYNAGKGQQHLKILKSIEQLPKAVKDKMFVVLPLTYQREDSSYIGSIEKALKDTGCDGFILHDFMDDTQIAQLCVSTDIFINAQITDALSSSMIEQFYANSIVLNGSWLKYGFLDQIGLKYYCFRDFVMLTQELVAAVDRTERGFSQVDTATKVLYEKCSWKTSRDKWANIL